MIEFLEDLLSDIECDYGRAAAEVAHSKIKSKLFELRLEEKAKQLSRIARGKRVMVKLNLSSDSELPKEVEGVPVGDDFAVFKEPEKGYGGWQVCHVHSGMKAMRARVKKYALVYASQIAAVQGIDWSSKDPLSGVDHKGDACRTCVAISRRANTDAEPLGSVKEYLEY